MAGFFSNKLQRMWNPPDDEYEEYYDEEEVEEEPRRVTRERSREPEPTYNTRSAGQDNRNVNLNRVVDMYAKTKQQVVLHKPVSFGDDARTIADDLLDRHTVVLNLEHTEKDVARRIVDFLSGVAFANNGKIKRVATNTFIITPYNVDLTGDDLLDELESSGVYY